MHRIYHAVSKNSQDGNHDSHPEANKQIWKTHHKHTVGYFTQPEEDEEEKLENGSVLVLVE